MAIYRNVHITFWTDSKVVDDFTPEDRYFYVYLLTNPHTNLCGCYEISLKQMSDELGYNKESITKLILRFHDFHKLIDYNEQTKEMLIYNWNKYNWTKSPKFMKALEKEIEKVKTIEFKAFLEGCLYGTDTVSIPYLYPMHTTVTATVPNNINNNNNSKNMINNIEQEQPPLITLKLDTEEDFPIYQSDIDTFKKTYPNIDPLSELKKISIWLSANPHKRRNSGNTQLLVFNWLQEEENKARQRLGKPIHTKSHNRFKNFNERTYDYDELEKTLLNSNTGS